MTIPTLMQRTQKQQTAVRVKQSYSILLQAIKLSEVDNGDFDSWELSQDSNAKTNTKMVFEQYFNPYLKSLHFCSTGIDYTCGRPVSNDAYNYVLANGSSLSIVVKNDRTIFIMIDVNGATKPNEIGKDAFYFDNVNYLGKILPAGWIKGLTREQILSGYTSFGNYPFYCKSGNDENQNRHGCTALLMLDGWEFKDDYPW